MKVLVIEADEQEQRLFQTWLQDHEVTIATDLRDAVAKATQSRFDAIVCDSRSPEIDGLRPADVIRFCRSAKGAKLVILNDPGDCDGCEKEQSRVREAVCRTNRTEAEALAIEMLDGLSALERRMADL